MKGVQDSFFQTPNVPLREGVDRFGGGEYYF